MNKVSLNGVEIYPFDSEQSLLSFVNDNKGILVAINAEKILHATDQTRGIINRNIGYCDGAGAQMALKQKGFENACKIPGCELWLKIVAQFYREKTFYLIGGKPQIIEETVSKLRKEYAGIHIIGYAVDYKAGYMQHRAQQRQEPLAIMASFYRALQTAAYITENGMSDLDNISQRTGARQEDLFSESVYLER